MWNLRLSRGAKCRMLSPKANFGCCVDGKKIQLGNKTWSSDLLHRGVTIVNLNQNAKTINFKCPPILQCIKTSQLPCKNVQLLVVSLKRNKTFKSTQCTLNYSHAFDHRPVAFFRGVQMSTQATPVSTAPCE